MGLLSILSLLPSVILLDGNGASPDDALRNGAATNDLVPLYMWVAPETKRRFVEMCEEENVSISEMLTRWASTRAMAGEPLQGDSSSNNSLLTDELEFTSPAAVISPKPAKSTSSKPPRSTDSQVEVDDRSAASKMSQQPSFFMLDLRAADLKLLKRLKQPLLATWTTGESKYMNLALNLALSVRRNAPHLERSFLCISLDREAKRTMRKNRFSTVLHAVQPSGMKDAIWKMRWLILHTFAHLGVDGLVLDSDIVVLQDPFQALYRDADFEVMTDHFWPELHLWQYWTRPEEHINTGCIFVKASPRTKDFLYEFLEDHNESEVAGIPRHWMDQQVFNKFVQKKLFHASSDLVHGLYESQVFWNPRSLVREAKPVRIRILNPVIVAHGMNYFWLRAHERPGQEQQPVVAHANGVDGKEYFLRDRGLWFIDDFEKRFEEQQRFLTYNHPTGMSLAEDFQHLTKALVVAVSLKRRLVLPNTMNCKNCPALEAYKAMHVFGSKNCTFDYFAWSQSFLGHHGDFVVESGIVADPEFQALSVEEVSLENLKKIFKQTSSFSKTSPSRVHIGNMERAYEAAIDAGFSSSMVFECRHHDWPVGWMACRDQRFVKFHGKFSRCEPSAEQAGCGYRGVTCCDAFWGWGEKLEYFTGKPWDLPCNCGLSDCQAVPNAGDPSTACCARPTEAGSQRCDRKIRMQAVPEVNTPEDSESLTSTAVTELDGPSSDPISFWQTCRLNRQLRGSDRTIEEVLWSCHRLATRFLLLRQNMEALGRWSRFAHVSLRRAPRSSQDSDDVFPPTWPNPNLFRPFDAETGELEEIRSDEWNLKVEHDLAQLRFLTSQVVPTSEITEGLKLLENVKAQDSSLYPGNRARFVPKLTAEIHLRDLQLEPLDGFFTIDDAFNRTLMRGLKEWFSKATIWHTPKFQGRILEASLLDGLNCEAVLKIAMALKSRFSGRLVLENIWAWKHNEYISPTPVHNSSWYEFAPDVLALLWVGGGNEIEGLELSSDNNQHFIQRQENRMVLWTPQWNGTIRAASDTTVADYAARRVDLLMSFRKSLGLKMYPGLTEQNQRWSQKR